MFQKTLGLKCKAKINFYKSVNGIHAPCYSGFWVQFHIRSLEYHIHWFWPNDLNHYVNGTTQKYAVARPLVPNVWLIRKGIDLIQKEAITLEETRFSFDRSHVQSLFGSQSSSPSSSHVACMSVHNIMWLIDVSCWPSTRGGKKVRQLSVFKITHHTNN
jgi:hypothetical protein